MADIIDNMLSRYEINNAADRQSAMHEVLQQVCLGALNRSDFFNKAAFYGGTCLRIFHHLDRFSEDLDFSLLTRDEDFNFENYFDAVVDEFKMLGRKVELNKKTKKTLSHVESAFLKDTTDIVNVRFQTEPTIKIKIEVDTLPPLGFSTESKVSFLPYSFMTNCFTLPSLFAGKMHAILFRKWKRRIKGRDWYDLEWYVRNRIPLDLSHFVERMHQTEGIAKEGFDKAAFLVLLHAKIDSLDLEEAKSDVMRFIQDKTVLNIWSKDYFHQLVDMVQVE